VPSDTPGVGTQWRSALCEAARALGRGPRLHPSSAAGGEGVAVTAHPTPSPTPLRWTWAGPKRLPLRWAQTPKVSTTQAAPAQRAEARAVGAATTEVWAQPQARARRGLGTAQDTAREWVTPERGGATKKKCCLSRPQAEAQASFAPQSRPSCLALRPGSVPPPLHAWCALRLRAPFRLAAAAASSRRAAVPPQAMTKQRQRQ
jgi:hypothetical protein